MLDIGGGVKGERIEYGGPPEAWGEPGRQRVVVARGRPQGALWVGRGPFPPEIYKSIYGVGRLGTGRGIIWAW